MINSKSIADEAFDLTNEVLADLELSRVPLSNCAMKAARLARLTGDTKFLKIFEYELSGYPSTPTGIPQDVFQLCREAGRVSEKKVKGADGEETIVERANTLSIEAIEGSLESARMRLEFCRPQPLSISSANPNQYVYGLQRNIPAETTAASVLIEAKESLASRRANIYEFTLRKHFELRVSSATEDIFETYRSKVDELLGALIPDELRTLNSITDNLRSENPKDWANAAHSCRRLLQAVADKVYPAGKNSIESSSGKKIKIGKENYINRLVLFCEDQMASATSQRVLSADLQFIGERLDAVFSGAQKGSHSEMEKPEAQRFVIHTYLTVGDILELRMAASEKGPDDSEVR